MNPIVSHERKVTVPKETVMLRRRGIEARKFGPKRVYKGQISTVKKITKLTSRALALGQCEYRNCGLCVFYIGRGGAPPIQA